METPGTTKPLSPGHRRMLIVLGCLFCLNVLLAICAAWLSGRYLLLVITMGPGAVIGSYYITAKSGNSFARTMGPLLAAAMLLFCASNVLAIIAASL